MAEKIEMFAGWDWDGSVIVGRERNAHIDKECTVVVHDGSAVRVFTESEVRAYIAALKDETMFKSVDEMLDRVARRVLSLDPA